MRLALKRPFFTIQINFSYHKIMDRKGAKQRIDTVPSYRHSMIL